MRGVVAFQRELIAKRYRYMRPGLETTPWNTVETGVFDPFGNQIWFHEPLEQVAPEDQPARR